QLSLSAAEVISAKPCSLARFFQINQTILAFRICQPLLSQPATFAASRRISRFSEAFDYALFFQTASTFSKTFFTTHNQHPKTPAASTTPGRQQRSPRVYDRFWFVQGAHERMLNSTAL
ncbi:hypothetical protein, partial [uncultured Variovorax sp.]|uniref:hypothetical protein n=1 Tax=uncultured Variovorax sp. TaxID=114708 RepID=UPI002601393B